MEHTKTGLVSFAEMKAGNIIIETLLDQEIGAYLYDPDNPLHRPPALQMRGWPYGFTKVKLAFNEFTDMDSVTNAKIKDKNSPDGFRKKYSDPKKFTDSDKVIATRTEFVNLRAIETHPYKVTIKTSDGADMEIGLLIYWRIILIPMTKAEQKKNDTDAPYRPPEVLMLPEFLDDSSAAVAEIFAAWAGTMSYREIRTLSTINTPEFQDEVMKKVRECNRDRFIDMGFEIIEVDAPVRTLMVGSKRYADVEQDQFAAEAGIKIAEHKKEAGLELNVLTQAENDTEIDFLEKKSTIIQNTVNGVSKNLADIQRATFEGAKGTTLTTVLNSSSVSEKVISDIFAAMKLNSEPRRAAQNQTGGNSI